MIDENRDRFKLEEVSCMEKKIYLRDVNSNDASALFSMCMDMELRKNGFFYFENLEDAENTIHMWQSDNYYISKAIVESATGEMVGIVCLGDMNRYRGYYELEYAISAKSRNKGYATQALHEFLPIAFEKCHAEVVAAWVRSHNTASVRVLEKCGFVFEGKLRKHARDKSDTLCYSITSEDWLLLGKNTGF